MSRYCVLYLAAVLLMLQAVKHGPSPLRLAVCGVLSGLTILTYNSLLAPLAVFMACAVLPVKWNPLRLPLTSVIVIVLLASLVVMPWSVRNLFVFKQWVTVRSNFGLEFRIGQNDFPDPWQIHPYYSTETRAHPESGKPAAFAAFGRDGREWVREHPGQVCAENIEASILLLDSEGPIRGIVRGCVVRILRFLAARHPKTSSRSHCRYAVAGLSQYIIFFNRCLDTQQPIGFSLYLMASVPIPGLLAKIRSGGD